MRSKRSCFNSGVFRQALAGFWPLWVLCLFVWIIALVLPLSSNMSQWAAYDSNYMMVRTSDYLLNAARWGSIYTCIASLLAAWASFHYLYSMCSAVLFHSLPLRREGLYLAGLTGLTLVNLAVFLITLVVCLAHGCLDMGILAQWLAVMTLTTILFYGMAVFCAMLTGHVLILPALYLALNFVALGMESVVKSVLPTFVYGMSPNFSTQLSFLSPLVELLMVVSVDTDFAAQTCSLQGWWSLAIYGLVGVLLTFVALLIYRRRHTETAGDVVAVRVLRPVFKYCLTLACAFALGAVLFFSTNAGLCGGRRLVYRYQNDALPAGRGGNRLFCSGDDAEKVLPGVPQKGLDWPGGHLPGPAGLCGRL